MRASLSEIIDTTKTGPIHLPKDGRAVEVAVGTLEQLLAMRDQNREVQRPHGLQELFIQLTGKTLRD